MTQTKTTYLKPELKRFNSLGKFPPIKTPTEITEQIRYVRNYRELADLKLLLKTDIENLILDECHKASEAMKFKYLEKIRFGLS